MFNEPEVLYIGHIYAHLDPNSDLDTVSRDPCVPGRISDRTIGCGELSLSLISLM